MPAQNLQRLSQSILVIGVLGLITSAIFYTITQYQLSAWVHTSGEVIALLDDMDPDTDTYAPVIQYRDVTAKDYTFTSPHYTTEIHYPVGASVDMMYNPQNPGEAQVVAFWYLYLWAIVSGFFALSCLLSSVVLNVGSRNYVPKEDRIDLSLSA